MDRYEAILTEKIKVMYDMVAQAMVHTGVDSFEEYKYNLGYLQALNRVLAEMETIAEEMRR
jgi:hypothetical protein